MPRFRWTLIVVVMTTVLTTACAPVPSAGEAASVGPDLTLCEDPRSQVCTMQYDPVCGSLGGDNYKTYSNACTACADGAVSGHRLGACE